jgi:hypothetical protein
VRWCVWRSANTAPEAKRLFLLLLLLMMVLLLL